MCWPMVNARQARKHGLVCPCCWAEPTTFHLRDILNEEDYYDYYDALLTSVYSLYERFHRCAFNTSQINVFHTGVF
jgi:hypothetical protein